MKTFQMLQQAYGEDCLSRTQCHEWYQHLKSGRTSIEDNPKSGRPSTSVDNDHVEKVAKEVGICKSSCHLILTEKRKMRHVAAKFVPHLLMHHSLSMNFLTKHGTTCPPATVLSKFGPCGLFLVPEAQILTKRSPISDCRGDRRKFDMGPSRRPAKHVPGHVPEMEKRWERCIKCGGECFKGDKFD